MSDREPMSPLGQATSDFLTQMTADMQRAYQLEKYALDELEIIMELRGAYRHRDGDRMNFPPLKPVGTSWRDEWQRRRDAVNREIGRLEVLCTPEMLAEARAGLDGTCPSCGGHRINKGAHAEACRGPA